MKFLLITVFIAIIFSSCGKQEIIGVPPNTYELKQNYPNPFTDTTRIEYGVPFVGQGGTAPWLRLIVYDRLKQKQATLMENASHPAGGSIPFSATWNGRGVNGIKVPAGLYYIELQQLNAVVNKNEDNLIVLLRVIALKQ